jgi:hypothetical protein
LGKGEKQGFAGFRGLQRGGNRAPGNVGGAVGEGQVVEGGGSIGQAIKGRQAEGRGLSIKELEVLLGVRFADAAALRQRVHRQEVLVEGTVWAAPAVATWKATVARFTGRGREGLVPSKFATFASLIGGVLSRLYS